MVQHWLKDLGAALAVGLGTIHGNIRIAHEVLPVGVGLLGGGILAEGHANAGAGVEVMAMDMKGLFQVFLHPIGHPKGFLTRAHIIQNHGKLIAPQPGHGVVAPQATLQTAANLHQEFIARMVSQAVVDHFEPIEVHIQHPKHPIGVALGLAEANFQPIDK